MTGSRAFTVYGAVMVALVAVAPLARLAWNGLTAPEVWTALSAPTAPLAAAGGVLCVWAAALVAGTARGPAVLTPFAAHVRMRGPELRWRIFARPMVFAASTAVGGSPAPRRSCHVRRAAGWKPTAGQCSRGPRRRCGEHGAHHRRPVGRGADARAGMGALRHDCAGSCGCCAARPEPGGRRMVCGGSTGSSAASFESGGCGSGACAGPRRR